MCAREWEGVCESVRVCVCARESVGVLCERVWEGVCATGRIHTETLLICKLGSKKITTQNDLCE